MSMEGPGDFTKSPEPPKPRKSKTSGRLPKPTPHAKPMPRPGDRVLCTEINTAGTVEYVDWSGCWRAGDKMLCRDRMYPIQVALDTPYPTGKHLQRDLAILAGGNGRYRVLEQRVAAIAKRALQIIAESESFPCRSSTAASPYTGCAALCVI